MYGTYYIRISYHYLWRYFYHSMKSVINWEIVQELFDWFKDQISQYRLEPIKAVQGYWIQLREEETEMLTSLTHKCASQAWKHSNVFSKWVVEIWVVKALWIIVRKAKFWLLTIQDCQKELSQKEQSLKDIQREKYFFSLYDIFIIKYQFKIYFVIK